MKGKINLIEPESIIEPEKALYINGGMCHRCEYRAHFFETGQALQPQCGEISMSVPHCTTWRPVRPVALKLKDENIGRMDRIFSDNINDAARLKFIKVVDAEDMRLRVLNVGRHMSASWGR